MDLPVIYSVVAKTPCKLLKIHVSDFTELVNEDVKSRMLKKTRKRINWLRNRMDELHEKRQEVITMNKLTKNLHETVAHLQYIYPNSTRMFRQNVQHQLLNDAVNDHRLVLF
jgi:CRP-like cAMP-binding protein